MSKYKNKRTIVDIAKKQNPLVSLQPSGWKSSIETVHKCPVTIATQGVIKISPHVLSAFSGAVKNPHEWLSILLGTTSEDGLEITVNDIYTPPNQTRSMALCDIDEAQFPFPDEVRTNLVGVIHSHNSMKPVFSGVDLGEAGLCTRYPISIVISSTLSNPACKNLFEATLLGFDYTAVGRYKLPCGAYGKSSFKILPLDIPDWPIDNKIIKGKHDYNYISNLSDCQRWKHTDDSNNYTYRRIADCGLEESSSISRESIFGSDGNPILSQLPKPEIYKFKSNTTSKSQSTFDDFVSTYSSTTFDDLDDIYAYPSEKLTHKDIDYWLDEDELDETKPLRSYFE